MKVEKIGVWHYMALQTFMIELSDFQLLFEFENFRFFLQKLSSLILILSGIIRI